MPGHLDNHPGIRGQDEQNFLGSGPSDCINRVRGPSVAIEITLRQLTVQTELCSGQHRIKIHKDLSNSKNLVVNLTKLLKYNVDLNATVEGRNKVM